MVRSRRVVDKSLNIFELCLSYNKPYRSCIKLITLNKRAYLITFRLCVILGNASLHRYTTMSVLRSPTGSDSGKRLGGSQPNLSEMQAEVEPSPHVTLRNKRKFTDDNDLIRNELSGLRQQMCEMMAVLTATRTDQAENINKLREDVTAIKSEVGNISSIIENIILEHKN